MVSQWIAALLLFASAGALAAPPPPDCSQSVPELPACSDRSNCFVDIKSSRSGPVDGDLLQDPRILLIAGVSRDYTTIRLGPDVLLDFEDLPDCLFPIQVRVGVTLMSVASFEAAPAPPAPAPVGPLGHAVGHAAGAVHHGEHSNPTAGADPHVDTTAAGGAAVVGDFGTFEAHTPQGVSSARTPQTLGPLLRYGKHRSIDSPTFFEVRCFHDAQINDGVRFSGFRLHGPSFGQQTEGDFGIRVVDCIDIEISNMELAGWGESAITIEGEGRITDPSQVRIFNNFFHHNQHPSEDGYAAGYGVNVGHKAWARISANVFDFNRHAIATPGDVGGYLAERNLVLKGGGYHDGFSNYTHQFDVHGGGENCWWSDDLCGYAGWKLWFYRNSFQFRKDNAIKLRGMPREEAHIDHNVFAHPGLEDEWGRDDAIYLGDSEHVHIGQHNIKDFDSFGQYAPCDFDGDGIDDLFLATGQTWWYSSYGEFHWSYLNTKTERLDQLELGYFDDDQRCDVLAQIDGHWRIVSGGYGDWQSLGTFGEARLADVEFGRFGADGATGLSPCRVTDHLAPVDRRTLRTTHAFWRRSDGQWLVTKLYPVGDHTWEPVQRSGFPMDQLNFGDFNGDGVTDVLAVEDGRWAISESAICPWNRINPYLGDSVGELKIENMDSDDKIDDVLRLERTHQRLSLTKVRVTLTWWRSKNGRERWEKFKHYDFSYTDIMGTGVVPGAVGVVPPAYGFVGRFGVAPGGATLVIDQERIGRFFSPAETERGAAPDWTSLFAY